MVPIPYGSRPTARADAGDSAVAFHCPTCGGSLRLSNGSWACGGCGYVPRHGAD